MEDKKHSTFLLTHVHTITRNQIKKQIKQKCAIDNARIKKAHSEYVMMKQLKHN